MKVWSESRHQWLEMATMNTVHLRNLRAKIARAGYHDDQGEVPDVEEANRMLNEIDGVLTARDEQMAGGPQDEGFA